MANLTFDFLHNYVTGERRASDPADAYQYDEGHVLEAVVPVAVTSCEIQYWIRGMEKADAYTPTSITQNTDNTYTILGNIPNSYFETNGDLRVYIVVTDGDASITTYEGYIHIKERQMPEDYVDDDPDNEAVRVIAEAQAAAATATEKAGEAAESAEQAQEILDSIPEDYSKLSEDVSDLKDDFNSFAEGKIELEYSIIKNSYPNAQGGFTPYNNWDRTDYIEVDEGVALYVDNTYRTNDNAWYDSSKNIIATFAMGVQSPVTLIPPTGAKYAVLSNKSSNMFTSIYVVQNYYATKDDYTTILDSAYVTDTASGSIASFPDGADNVPVKSLRVNIEPVQSGSGDPSPDNVRPISGHTSAVVTRTGVNVWDEEWVVASNNRINSKNPISVVSGESYYFKTPVAMYINAVDKNGAYVSYLGGVTNGTMVIPDGVKYIGFSVLDSYGTTYNHDISINYPSTDHDYHEGHVQTVTIDLGDTIYGGTLDVTTGVLTVDRYMCDLQNTYPYAVSSQTDSVAVASLYLLDPAVALPSGKFGALISNRFSSDIESGMPGRCVLVDDHIYFVISKSELTSVDYIGIREWISNHPTQMCYGLTNPQTIQLTAQEVRTLLGQNNVFADCGDVEVEYRADTKLYIEKLIAPTEDDMIADHAISANSFFMIGNTLYRATTAIASGATITVGTNATKLSLSDALNALA